MRQKMRRNKRINVRLNEAELSRLNELSAVYGDTQSSTLRTLLTVNEQQDKYEENQQKSTREINSLRAEILNLKTQLSEFQNWLKDRVE